MPFEIGLLASQQDSFEHHEELSKLSNETDVRKNEHTIEVIASFVFFFFSLCQRSSTFHCAMNLVKMIFKLIKI